MIASAFSNVSAAPQPLSRNAVIALVVLLLHAGLIWALQSGLHLRVDERVVPIEVLSEFVEPPLPNIPKVESAPVRPAAPARITPKKTAPKMPAPPPAQPFASAEPTPAPTSLVSPTLSIPPVPLAVAPLTPVSPAGPAAAARVQLPSSDADYLQNPKPPYPAISKRLGEQGKVVVRVLIGVDGQAEKAEIRESSGFDRLDQAALTTVLRWRYVPGKRGGVAEGMWFNVPINFVLE